MDAEIHPPMLSALPGRAQVLENLFDARVEDV
jgi:hypothetical protein